MRRRLPALVAAVFALGGALGTVALADGIIGPLDPPDPGLDRSADPASTAGPPKSPATPVQNATARLPCTGIKQPLNFPNAWAGTSLDGLPLTAVIRRCDVPRGNEPIRANYVSYIYGDCYADDDAGCAPPIEIQSWPSGERNRQMLSPVPGRPESAGSDTTVAGDPAAMYDDGTRLEIYRRSSTIVIFGDAPARVERFAGALETAPRVLSDLEQRGVAFRAGCADDAHYCAGAVER
jgi:hypothetical protein